MARTTYENPPKPKASANDGMHRVLIRQTPQMTDLGIDKVEEFLQQGFVIEKTIGKQGHIVVKPQSEVDAERKERDERYLRLLNASTTISKQHGSITGTVKESVMSHEDVAALARGEGSRDDD